MKSSLLFVFFGLFVLCVQTGCPSVDVVEGSRCDAERRCTAGAAEVCGEDGKTYACEAMASCEGVIVDPSGQACMSDPVECEPVACRLFCPDGFATDERGCEICECEAPSCPGGAQPACDGQFEQLVCEEIDGCNICRCEVQCPPVLPPDCSPGQEIVCDEGDLCGTSCRCEGDACPVIDDAPCPPDSRMVCEPDEQGCEMCTCVPAVCDDVEPVECSDADEMRVCQDVDGDGCEECRCEPLDACLPPSPPECPGTLLVPVLAENTCEGWRCELPVCEFIEPPTCNRFDEFEICWSSPEGCPDCWCEPVSCPAMNRPGCPGQEIVRGLDDEGCTIFECSERAE